MGSGTHIMTFQAWATKNLFVPVDLGTDLFRRLPEKIVVLAPQTITLDMKPKDRAQAMYNNWYQIITGFPELRVWIFFVGTQNEFKHYMLLYKKMVELGSTMAVPGINLSSRPRDRTAYLWPRPRPRLRSICWRSMQRCFHASDTGIPWI